ncbi:MAG: ATP-binding protein [Acidobacteria bacterium]|nr:ATP-binding protein [Acidobacteriota bacterium]
MRSLRVDLQLIVLVLLTLAGVLAGAVNLWQQRGYQLPDDGVVWVDFQNGVLARDIAAGSPAATAGLQAGDLLLSINGQPVATTAEVSRQVFELGAGALGRYQVLRQGQSAPMEIGIILEAERQADGVRSYLQIVGVLYLLMGLFVLLRRFTAPRATHFYLFCLTSFILFAYSYTGKLDTFDWFIYWTSVTALLLQPALFAHFCLVYPQSQHGDGRKQQHGSGRQNRNLTLAWISWIYGPAAVLWMAHLAAASGLLRFTAPLVEVRELLDRLAMGYLAVMYLAGIGLLAAAYRKARSVVIRKQMLWVLGGSVLAILPFAAIYAAPYFWGILPGKWMNLSALSLIFLPLAFSYAIIRHRLLDVDVILGRGIACTLATGVLVGGYLAVAALAGDFFRTNFPAAGTLGLVLAVIATGLLFQPLASLIRAKLERYFLRNRYDYREALLAFGRELSSETDLDRMIGALLDQLVHTLKINRAAVFLPAAKGSFALHQSVGLAVPEQPDFGFLQLLGKPGSPAEETEPDRLFFGDWEQTGLEEPSWRSTVSRMEMHYYFSCRAKNRTVAVLGLGETEDGGLLSEQDVALVETLSGYLAVAVENARLFESLAAKASEYERLRQFSENILESVNVGLLAVDLEDRVETVNTPLEMIYPIFRKDSRGKKLAEILPADLAEQLDRLREDEGIHNLHQYRVRGANGEERVLNIAIAPLLSQDCESIGRLIVFDDVTDRVQLEMQLAQSEKLSSVGLLAAGVAHEVNTPLAVISSQAQMLAKYLRPGDKHSRILEKIISQTFRASQIINSLLNFSRTKGSSFAALEINPIIRETLLLLEHQFQSAGIKVESHLGPDLPPISGNSDKLQQVFLNLFLNAKDAMPEGGQLRITTWAENSSLRIEISDTGTGIPPEHLKRIYDPFFTTKSTGRGTGLGLAVSYGIIQELSGKIQVESPQGLGTQFRLEFPILRKAVHA